MFNNYLQIGQGGGLNRRRSNRRTVPVMEHLDARIVPSIGFNRAVIEPPSPPSTGPVVLLVDTASPTPPGRTSEAPGGGASPGHVAPFYGFSKCYDGAPYESLDHATADLTGPLLPAEQLRCEGPSSGSGHGTGPDQFRAPGRNHGVFRIT
jgi:hypothetical protein